MTGAQFAFNPNGAVQARVPRSAQRVGDQAFGRHTQRTALSAGASKAVERCYGSPPLRRRQAWRASPCSSRVGAEGRLSRASAAPTPEAALSAAFAAADALAAQSPAAPAGAANAAAPWQRAGVVGAGRSGGHVNDASARRTPRLSTSSARATPQPRSCPASPSSPAPVSRKSATPPASVAAVAARAVTPSTAEAGVEAEIDVEDLQIPASFTLGNRTSPSLSSQSQKAESVDPASLSPAYAPSRVASPMQLPSRLGLVPAGEARGRVRERPRSQNASRATPTGAQSPLVARLNSGTLLGLESDRAVSGAVAATFAGGAASAASRSSSRHHAHGDRVSPLGSPVGDRRNGINGAGANSNFPFPELPSLIGSPDAAARRNMQGSSAALRVPSVSVASRAASRACSFLEIDAAALSKRASVDWCRRMGNLFESLEAFVAGGATADAVDRAPPVRTQQDIEVEEDSGLAARAAKEYGLEISEALSLRQDFVQLDAKRHGVISRDAFEGYLRTRAHLPMDKPIPPHLRPGTLGQEYVGLDMTWEDFISWIASRYWTEEMTLASEKERRLRQLARDHNILLLDAEVAQRLFDEYDYDRSGSIEEEEFKSIYYKIFNVKDPSDVSALRLQRYWREVDNDGSGRVCFPEFLLWYKNTVLKQTTSRFDFDD